MSDALFYNCYVVVLAREAFNDNETFHVLAITAVGGGKVFFFLTLSLVVITKW